MFNGPLRQYFSQYRAVSREGERKEKRYMSEKFSKQPPPAPTTSAIGPCPTVIQISRTPRHWKFTLYLRTIRGGGGRVVQRCWMNFQCRGVLLIWIIVGQRPIALAIGAGGGCLDIFSLICHFSFLSPSLWNTARYRLKYCLKGPLNSEQPTNQIAPSDHP